MDKMDKKNNRYKEDKKYRIDKERQHRQNDKTDKRLVRQMR